MWAPMSENAVPPATEIEFYNDMKETDSRDRRICPAL